MGPTPTDPSPEGGFGLPAASLQEAGPQGEGLRPAGRSALPRVRVGLIVAALLTGSSCGGLKPPSAASAPPTPVVVVKAMQMDVPVHAEWVATLEGYVNAQIQPQVSGYLIRQDYQEGSYVHKGDVLFEIDPRPFQAVLDQAKGQLAQARAQLYLADVNVKRDTPLVQERAIAQSQLDTEIAAQMLAKAAIQADEAAVEQAQLNLGFTSVRSLVDGIAGIATTQMGNLVSPSTVLTTVSQVDPIKVYFPISEQEYLRFTSKLPKKNSAGDLLHASDSPSLDLILSDGSTYPHKGRVIFTDRQVDPQTGTIRVVAAFANPGNILRPGQFGRVRALLGVRQGAVLVPQRCVTELQGTYEVALVTAQNSISIRKVKVGERVGLLWVINEGLAPGETVVAEGTSKVRDGMLVTPTVETPAPEGSK
ncbi:MAG TPA: efflux RND transporter periplasmic adaptor subunit [Terriglobia bacterium]|nr:efflux RND transporter periplasmic adaptor subunit [Terriglobia bacterium]